MELKDLGYKGEKLKKLNANGVSTVSELLYKAPRKYNHFDRVYDIDYSDEVIGAAWEKKAIVLTGKVISVTLDKSKSNNASIIKIKMENPATGCRLYVNVFGSFYEYEKYNRALNQIAYVGGVVEYKVLNGDHKLLSVVNPILFTMNKSDLKIYPVYKKYKGISADYYTSALKTAYETVGEDYIPARLQNRFGLPDYKTAVKYLHFPNNADDIENAEKRIVFDDLLYFTSKMINNNKDVPSATQNLVSREVLSRFIASLPYKLTDDQKNAIQILTDSFGTRRVEALIQGDVSCGKTVVAMALMLYMAENNYSSILVAPTTILAKQHFEELSKHADNLGFKVAFLCSETSTADRKKYLKGIESGEYKLIVGTHSCFSEKIAYSNVGLVITDEEHKFGVIQRESIKRMSNTGIHTITMSATPIPRSLATSIYGKNLDVITIKQMPGGRKKTKTAICSSLQTIFDFIEKELKAGSQAYVVCPLIDEADEESIMNGVSSVEDTAKLYDNYFSPKGYNVGVITGKTPGALAEQIKSNFVDNKVQILVATTVIEVGINVPNATVMVITSAERFGLATLHQLRGRVGRGDKQSYCILQKTSDEVDASNLEILQNETDGFEIAKADLMHRGSGNLLGTLQSGANKFVSLIIRYPALYERMLEISASLSEAERSEYINTYEEMYPSCL